MRAYSYREKTPIWRIFSDRGTSVARGIRLMSSTRQEAAKTGDNGAFRVGGWIVAPATGRIARDGEEIQLEPKVMDVLVHLARRPDRVVSREELEAAVWAGRVVGYDAVSNAIIKLRKAFGDDARRARLIETLPKRGYRLRAAVEPMNAPADRPASALSVVVRRFASNRRTAIYAAAAALLLAVVAAGWYLAGPQRAPASPAGRPSIVVLPFENLVADPEQDYFSNGITEDLITELSRIPDLAVIARGSAFAYRGDADLARLRRELGVRYVLRGSVRRDAARVRLNVQLIDAGSGRHLWAERYDATLVDSFGVQDAITDQIASVLKVRLMSGADGLARRYTASVEAYDHFLRGLDHYGRRAPDDVESAKASYERAIALDPGFARAYANLGLVYARQAIDGWAADSRAALDRAGALADQALALDAGLADVHFVRAYVALFRRDHAGALHALDRALALRPSYADAYGLLAWVLHYAGRPEQARPALRQAIQLNPRVPSPYLLVQGEIDFTTGRYPDAIASLERALEMNPTAPRTHLWLAAAYARAGRIDDARWMTEQLRVLHPTLTLTRLRDAFPFQDGSQLERLLDGLRRAGLPE
jgi:adenylate cyclase